MTSRLRPALKPLSTGGDRFRRLRREPQAVDLPDQDLSPSPAPAPRWDRKKVPPPELAFDLPDQDMEDMENERVSERRATCLAFP